jgi:hypothetical protein
MALLFLPNFKELTKCKKNLFIAIRLDGVTDAIIFRDAQQARMFMDLHPN